MTGYEEEEEFEEEEVSVLEETEETWDELLEDDEVSPEEQGFALGWIEAGKSKKSDYLVEDLIEEVLVEGNGRE